MADDTITAEGEAIERKALASLHDAADAALREHLGLRLVHVGDGVASVAGALPPSAIVVNRVVGIGRYAPIEASELAGIVELYRSAGVARYFVQPDPEANAAELTPVFRTAGLEPARGWQKFVRGRDEPVPEVETEFEVREIRPDDATAFARIACDAFDLGEAAIPWIARLPMVPGYRVFAAMADGVPAGVGTIFLSDGVAWTDFGATAPRYRGRGAQSAVLAHRVRAALEAGANRIHTCTGVAVPGEAQHSYNNIKRCGFAEVHVRMTWAPPGG